MPDANDILAAAKAAAEAVIKWGESTAAVAAATEAHFQALAAASEQEDARASYMASRNIEEDEEHVRHSTGINQSWSSAFAARREAATALQAKRVAEAVAKEAKAVAEAALDKATALARATDTL
jgi:hypothetical protein